MFHVNIAADRPFKFGNLVELQILGGMVKVKQAVCLVLWYIDFYSSFLLTCLVWFGMYKLTKTYTGRNFLFKCISLWRNLLSLVFYLKTGPKIVCNKNPVVL